jgi:hypothetical protein
MTPWVEILFYFIKTNIVIIIISVSIALFFLYSLWHTTACPLLRLNVVQCHLDNLMPSESEYHENEWHIMSSSLIWGFISDTNICLQSLSYCAVK